MIMAEITRNLSYSAFEIVYDITWMVYNCFTYL